ncbi:MAG: preprotein translocase subunit YajC [Christensenellaceae bacterium]|jgi:preprotein translocase YajC subunit|nr:preprotein translocase subunit YajC [Christensenellaceae bacterium]
MNLILAAFDPSIILIGVVILAMFIMMFMSSKKQMKRQQEQQAMLNELRPGVRVKTYSGIIGTIKEVREVAPSYKTILLETGSAKDKTILLFDIQAVMGVVDEVGILQAQMQSAGLTAPLGKPEEVKVEEVKIEETVIEPEKTESATELNAEVYVKKATTARKRK